MFSPDTSPPGSSPSTANLWCSSIKSSHSNPSIASASPFSNPNSDGITPHCIPSSLSRGSSASLKPPFHSSSLTPQPSNTNHLNTSSPSTSDGEFSSLTLATNLFTLCPTRRSKAISPFTSPSLPNCRTTALDTVGLVSRASCPSHKHPYSVSSTRIHGAAPTLIPTGSLLRSHFPSSLRSHVFPSQPS